MLISYISHVKQILGFPFVLSIEILRMFVSSKVVGNMCFCDDQSMTALIHCSGRWKTWLDFQKNKKLWLVAANC